MNLFRRKETRSLENPNTPATSSSFIELFGLGGKGNTGITVTIDKALGVPSVWAAVNFLAGTLAGLPLNHYQKTDSGREKQRGLLQSILHTAVNDEMSSFEWRKYSFERVFTKGRAYTLIDRNARNEVVNLWPLNPDNVTVKFVSGRKFYVLAQENNQSTTYPASDVIDIPFMLKSDGLSYYSPILSNQETIALMIAANDYGSRFFSDGGVPPFAVSGPFQTGKSMKSAREDLAKAIKTASKDRRLALTLPSGHEIKSIGADPEKSQLVELKKYCNEEIARMYSLPVLFIQDLSKGTYANTEQQDLHLVKHTIKRWVEQTEQEMNLKLFGRDKPNEYVEFNLDGLLRGDFKTRMEGYAKGIQNGLIKPNEARRKENLPDDPSGNNLMIQGATVPIDQQINPDIDQQIPPDKEGSQ